jgi:hypothetical protein
LAGLAEPVASTVDVQADWQTEASQTAPVASDLPAATPSAADPWAPLLQAGMALLAQLAQPASAAGSGPAAPGLSALVHTDAATGERQLRLPLPAPATLQRLADGLAALATALQPPGRS